MARIISRGQVLRYFHVAPVPQITRAPSPPPRPLAARDNKDTGFPSVSPAPFSAFFRSLPKQMLPDNHLPVLLSLSIAPLGPAGVPSANSTLEILGGSTTFRAPSFEESSKLLFDLALFSLSLRSRPPAPRPSLMDEFVVMAGLRVFFMSLSSPGDALSFAARFRAAGNNRSALGQTLAFYSANAASGFVLGNTDRRINPFHQNIESDSASSPNDDRI